MKTITLKPSADQKRSVLAGLNDSQREAASTIDGPLLVLAGAGSGKTRALTFRIAYFLENGIAPHSILALTFTNKAAKEMKERIAGMVSEEAARRLWIGTFHSVFARILREEAEALGFTRSFTIYDAEDSLSLIRAIMKTLGISQQQYTPQAVRSAISSAKNNLLTWQQYQQSAYTLFEKQCGLTFQEYEKKLRSNNAMDFDDLLINMIRLLQNNADILQKWQNRFRYLLVDEYQDTNKAQFTVLDLLAAKHKNLCVVGDDAQSIYGWRGADIRNILDFQKSYPGAKVVRLEQNYRSTKTILAAANDIIANNADQLQKELWTDNDEGELIALMRCRDDREEASRVAKTILSAVRSQGRSFRNFAVLYRTNAQSQALEDALRTENIPYSIVGGISFYRRKEVKDALSYLRLVANPTDGESFLRAINEPARGIGKTSLNRIQAYADERGISLLDACRDAEAISTLQTRARTAAQGFAGFIDGFIRLKEQASLQELAKSLIESSGILDYYKNDGTEESLDRWNNVQRVLSHVAEYHARYPEASLDRYLEEIALVDESDKHDPSKNYITLMTMHAAKGLEFPVVFIVGLEKGLFPLGKTEEADGELEEERRLFYVGVTRAEEKLYFSYAERRYRFGELTYPTPSLFIDEVRPELFEALDGVTRASGIRQRENSFSGAPRIQKSSKRDDPVFDDMPNYEESYSQIPETTQRAIRVGMNVKHVKFGRGKVMALAGSGDSQRATVYFQSVGRKNMMLKFANLTPV